MSNKEKNVMENNITKEKIGRCIMFFQILRKSNFACFLYKKTRNSILMNWLFIAIPVLLYAVNIFVIVLKKVFWNENIRMSFVRDISNSVVFTFLFFLSYFLSSIYPMMFETWILNGIKKEYFRELTEIYKNKYKSILWPISIGLVLFMVGLKSGYTFYSFALKNGPEIWTYHIGKFGRIYYCIILVLIWYHSLSLLGMALLGGFAIYWSLKDDAICYVKEYFNKNISIVNAVNMLLSTFSYGLFYILGAILFILNDKVAEKNKIINTFSNDIAAFFLLLIVMLIVLVAFIPLQELFRLMKKEKALLINSYDEKILDISSSEEKEMLIRERNDIVGQSLIITSGSNKFFIIISILIPLIGVIFQGIELFD